MQFLFDISNIRLFIEWASGLASFRFVPDGPPLFPWQNMLRQCSTAPTASEPHLRCGV